MYPFVVKVHYWDDVHTPAKVRHTHVLVYAESFAAAAAKTETYFGDSLEDMKVMCAGDEGTLFEVSGHVADALIVGLGNYKDGIEHIREKEESEGYQE